MEIKAVQKYVRMSPRKLRLITPLVRGLSPVQAVEVLPNIGKRAAEPIRKVIMSAIANAKEKKLSEGDLVFKEIQINEGPSLKRMRAGARGMYKPYQRKMSHIRVVLSTKSQAPNTKSETNSNFKKAKSEKNPSVNKKSKSIQTERRARGAKN